MFKLCSGVRTAPWAGPGSQIVGNASSDIHICGKMLVQPTKPPVICVPEGIFVSWRSLYTPLVGCKFYLHLCQCSFQVQLWMVICVLPTRPCYRTGGVLSILHICVAMTFSLQNWRCLCLCDICVFVCSFHNTVLGCYLCPQYSSVPLDRPVL